MVSSANQHVHQASSLDPRVIVALDFDTQAKCLALVDRLDPQYCRLKIGKELFTACGPALVSKVQDKGFDVFLDLKFHDIPATVGKAVKAAADLGVWMVNVHASGGTRMMNQAKESLAGFAQPPLLIAVTVLTSMDSTDLLELGLTLPVEDQVSRLATLANNCGLDGLVCSAQEASALKSKFGAEFKLVTPGIRLPNAVADDQRRVMTPIDAIQAGSDYLVVGRPITQADDPSAVCRQISESIQVV